MTTALVNIPSKPDFVYITVILEVYIVISVLIVLADDGKIVAFSRTDVAVDLPSIDGELILGCRME